MNFGITNHPYLNLYIEHTIHERLLQCVLGVAASKMPRAKHFVT